MNKLHLRLSGAVLAAGLALSINAQAQTAQYYGQNQGNQGAEMGQQQGFESGEHQHHGCPPPPGGRPPMGASGAMGAHPHPHPPMGASEPFGEHHRPPHPCGPEGMGGMPPGQGAGMPQQ